MESPRDPLPADVSAEPEPADPPPTEPLHLGEPAEPLPPGDADLIAASRAGDAAAYDTLYRRHVASAHSLARQLVRNRAEADDVVAETFAKILDLLHRGGGPDDAFRPYLLTAVRRSAYDRHRAERRQLVTDEMETFDRGVPFADPAVADLERTMIARAFASLPERWQAVLWHTEVEGARPADVAPLLGLTANGVAALAYRAREGLRQAYLADRPGDTVALSGPVVWAGLYWAWTGRAFAGRDRAARAGRLRPAHHRHRGQRTARPWLRWPGADSGAPGLRRGDRPAGGAGRPGPRGRLDHARPSVLCLRPALVRPPGGKLPRHERSLPSRRGHRRRPLSPARTPSTHHPASVGIGPVMDAMEPGIHGVRTHWIRGFMAFGQPRRTGKLTGRDPTVTWPLVGAVASAEAWVTEVLDVTNGL